MRPERPIRRLLASERRATLHTRIRVADKNVAKGPGVWQTYDIEYQAARFTRSGMMTERDAARVTVKLNGEVIHNDFKLSVRRNKYAAFREEPLSPIVLQSHGSPVKQVPKHLAAGEASREINEAQARPEMTRPLVARLSETRTSRRHLIRLVEPNILASERRATMQLRPCRRPDCLWLAVRRFGARMDGPTPTGIP